MNRLRNLIADYPIMAAIAAAAAGYYGGPQGVEWLRKVAVLLGLV